MKVGHPKRVLLSALAIALLSMASTQVGFCSIGGAENTVTIYPSVDVYAFDEYSRPQLKFDIGEIPPGSNILSAKLWLYRLNADNWDGNVALYRVEDQVWDETITAGEFDNQILTDGENHAGKFMSHGWDNLDVLAQLKPDYDADHTFTSFRLMWTNDNENEPSIGVDDGRLLLINGETEELSVVFCASEYDGRGPYLEVTCALSYGVSISISPTYKSKSPGETLNFTVTVKNAGNVSDNYILTVEDNAGWGPTLDDNLLENIAPDESGTTTLRVTIPENAVPCTKDKITVIATSQADNTIENNASCIAHAKAPSEPPGDGDGAPSEDTTPPPTPSLISPTNGADITDNTPLLDWSDVSDPSGVTYDISIAGDAGFASIILLKTSLTPSTYELAPTEALTVGAYYWRVRAVDGAGNAGSWSENWLFTVSAAPPPPAPAAFTVSDLIISPPEVALGEEISISVTVKNTGDLEGVYTVTLKINDVVEATENVTLTGGATKSVTFKVVENMEGTYNVKVDGLTGSFSVVAPPPPGSPWIIRLGIPIIALLVIPAAAAAAFYMRRRRKSSKHRARSKR